jgi:hypothetical protein
MIAIAGLNACGGGSGDSGTSVPPATCITTGPACAVLTWDAVTGATGYRIYFVAADGTNSQLVADVPAPTTTDTVTGLASGTAYCFTATAYDTSESGISNVVCKTIP